MPADAVGDGGLSSWLSDALRLRQNALDEALRRRAGPAMVGWLVNDIHRLTAEYESALYVEQSLRALAARGPVSDNR
ncbi:MAG: hypothetical protein ACK4PH_07670 [Aquincola tertiaricarbonis]|uniref:hypothetical protein n=1 Tax=Aquincola TaxID=391952 RepID=UPI0012ED905D|nr:MULTISPECIES: hypothetical protein [Aquincola]MCR5868700.1 hypothetical protein [Aquincola sp. J276]